MKIKMVHPNLGEDRAQWVTQEQFDLVWSAVGWEEVERVAEEGDVDSAGTVIAPDTPVASPLPSWELDHEGKPLDPDYVDPNAPVETVDEIEVVEVKGPAKNRTNPPKS